MIRFPRMHIAQSVMNRILNINDEIEADAQISALPEPAIAPDPPDPMMEGAQLDVALQQPVASNLPPPDDGPNGPAVNTLEASLSGGSPLQGLLDGISTG